MIGHRVSEDTVSQAIIVFQLYQMLIKAHTL